MSLRCNCDVRRLALAWLLLATSWTVLADNRFTLSTMIGFDYLSLDQGGSKSYISERQLVEFIPRLELELSPQAAIRVESAFTEDPVALRSAYLKWTPKTAGLETWLGQRMVPFSYQRMVTETERPGGWTLLTAEERYGIPGYHPGLTIEHRFKPELKGTGFIGRAKIATAGGSELRFTSPWQTEIYGLSPGESGSLLALRGEYNYGNPQGYYRDRSIGDRVATLALALYGWHPDEMDSTHSLNSVRGASMDIAVRWLRWSAVSSLNRIDATADNSDRATGLLQGGGVGIRQASLQIGYQLWPGRLEPLLSYSRMGASNWEHLWERRELALNIYITSIENRLQIAMGGNKNQDGQAWAESYTSLRWIYTLN